MLQGSDEWRQARCGSVGASDAPRVVRRIKSGGFSADRESLMAEKVLERLTDTPFEIYKSAAMLQGTAREPEARLLYEMVRGSEVEQVGLVPHPSIKGSHCSPDGFVSGTGLIEIKSPMPAAHLDALLTKTISNDHFVQMQWQMACTGRAWCDYISFSSDFPPAMQLWISRVERNPRLIGELESEITQFIRELEAKIAKLSREYAVAA